MVTDDPSRGPEAPWQTPDPTADPKARSRRTGLGAPAIPQDTTPHLRAVHVALGMTPGAGVTPTPLPMMVEAGMTLEEAKGRLSMAETGTAPPAPPPAPPWVPNAPSDPLLRPRRVMQDDSPNWVPRPPQQTPFWSPDLDIGGQVIQPRRAEALREVGGPTGGPGAELGGHNGPPGPHQVATTVPQGPTGPTADRRPVRGPVPPEPSASTAPSSVTSSVAATVQRRLSERPEEIRETARALSKAIADQIAELNASKPNEPDRLAQQNDFVAFLQTIAHGLDALAENIDKAIAAGSAEKPEPIYNGRSELPTAHKARAERSLKLRQSHLDNCQEQVAERSAEGADRSEYQPLVERGRRRAGKRRAIVCGAPRSHSASCVRADTSRGLSHHARGRFNDPILRQMPGRLSDANGH
jgi:hypothetical protein